MTNKLEVFENSLKKKKKFIKNPLYKDYLNITKRDLIAKFPKYSKSYEDRTLLIQSLAFYGLGNTIKASKHKEADKTIDVINLASIFHKEDHQQ
jgi:hypothetical protein